MTLPPPPAGFSWVTEPWGPGLRADRLQAVVPHIFTTRALELRGDENAWASVARSLNVAPADIVRLRQVHGKAVVAVRRGGPAIEGRPEADVIVSDDPGRAIAVQSADCVPLLLADALTGAVAAVHAGWRGTAAGAAREAVDAMGREFGSRVEDLVVAIGPSIGTCCYEVGTELVDAFAAAGHPRHLIDRWFLAPPAPRGSTERPRLRLDLLAANRDQLELAGVPAEHIGVAGLCTASNLDVLYSFRAEGDKTGRLAAVIRARDGR